MRLCATLCTCVVLCADGKLRCVHDGTWKECDEGHETTDFIRTVCDAYKGPVKLPICNSTVAHK